MKMHFGILPNTVFWTHVSFTTFDWSPVEQLVSLLCSVLPLVIYSCLHLFCSLNYNLRHLFHPSFFQRFINIWKPCENRDIFMLIKKKLEGIWAIRVKRQTWSNSSRCSHRYKRRMKMSCRFNRNGLRSRNLLEAVMLKGSFLKGIW